VPAPRGNTRALVHSLYSARRDLPERAREMAEQLLELPHLTEADQPAAAELAALVVLIENVDRALADGRVENRRGQVRTLLENASASVVGAPGVARGVRRDSGDPGGVGSRLAGGGLAGEIARRRGSGS
jgi:hypothetical protein